MWVFFKEFNSFSYKNSMEMWYDKNNDIENLRKEDFMRKKIYGIATALALAMGCSLFLTYPVQAAETQDVQQEESDYFTLPNGNEIFSN